MYRISPLSVVPDTIDLPKCMYHIKPLNGMDLGSYTGDPIIKRVKMEPELQAIEDRQLEVITRLRQLRDTVDGLLAKAGSGSGGGGQQPKSKDGESRKNTAIKQSSPKITESDIISDIDLPNELVIEANPNRPPLSLLFFKSLAPSLRTVSHTHSSCSQKVDPKLISMFSRDTTAPPNSTIRVVWKNNSGSRLTPPTLGSCGVEGESNVARYLSRVLTKSNDSSLNYDALPLEDLVLVDGVLESSCLVDNSTDQFLNSLQAYVQRKSGGGASARTIADFVGYSTLQYLTKQQPSRSFQKSLIDWMNCLTNEVPSLS